MCLIVDSNKVCEVFVRPTREFERLNRAVITGKAKIAYGGELTREYRRVFGFWRLLIAFDRQGAAMHVNDARIDQETERVRRMNICRSDDPHIIALARVGRVRLICSDDARLRIDFRNPRLLSNPRGSIYTSSNHHNLLRRHCPT